MGKEIGVREWLSELERVSRAGDAQGFATRDLCSELGLSERVAGERIRRWARNGLIAFSGRRQCVSVDGRAVMIPVYRAVKRPKRKT